MKKLLIALLFALPIQAADLSPTGKVLSLDKSSFCFFGTCTYNVRFAVEENGQVIETRILRFNFAGGHPALAQLREARDSGNKGALTYTPRLSPTGFDLFKKWESIVLGFAQTVVYLSDGMRLEAEVITRVLGAVQGSEPELGACEHVSGTVVFGDPTLPEPLRKFSIGSPKVNGNPVKTICATFHYSLETGTTEGVEGTLVSDSEEFIEAVAILWDRVTGKQLWGCNLKHRGFSNYACSSPYQGSYSGKLTMQLFTFKVFRTLEDRVE